MVSASWLFLWVHYLRVLLFVYIFVWFISHPVSVQQRTCPLSTVRTNGGSTMMWGMFSWHTLAPLTPTEHHLNVNRSPAIWTHLLVLYLVGRKVQPSPSKAYLEKAAAECVERNNFSELQTFAFQSEHVNWYVCALCSDNSVLSCCHSEFRVYTRTQSDVMKTATRTVDFWSMTSIIYSV